MSKHRNNKNKNLNETKDITNSVQKENETKNAPLTDTQVYDVLSFAQSVYDYAYNTNHAKLGCFDGTYSPHLTNERLSEIGLNPKKIQTNALDKILESPVTNQNKLIGYSEFLKFNDMIAKRTLGYLGNLPAFDYTFTCTNINDPSEYKTKEYKEDLNIVKNFLSKFDVRGQFSYVNRRTFEIDAFYSVFRMDGQRYEFQELPYQFCKITGKNTSWGFQFDFDMSWFDKAGLSIKQYPPIFKTMRERVVNGQNAKKYNPSNKLDKRKGTYCLWAQTSSLPDKGNFACFKMNGDIFASLPFLTPMFQDSVNKPIIRQLQNDQYIIAAQKIMIGLIPLLKDQKSGQVKDALAISPETMGRFLGLLKRGLSNAIKITGAPFEDVKQVEFDTPQTSIYNQSNEVEASSSGATGEFIYSTKNLSATAVNVSRNIDEIISTSVYPQYERWLSSMINHLTKKYKFNFRFEGTKLDSNRETRRKTAQEYASMGIFNEQKLAAAWGMDIFELTNHLEMGMNSGFFELLRLPPNAHTASLGSVGRPKTDSAADSTERSMDYIKP